MRILIRRLRARLWPPTSLCSNCGRELREWHRHPCPTCGYTARTHARSATERLGFVDKAD